MYYFNLPVSVVSYLQLIISIVVTLSSVSYCSAQSLKSIWFNNGEDKVTQDELRLSRGGEHTKNSVWDGTTLKLFGARNEVVNANMIIEAPTFEARGVSVKVSSLVGPKGFQITGKSAPKSELFKYVGRNIELFYVRYLQIKGLSLVGYERYDERHVPMRFRRPYSGEGVGKGAWRDRPDMMKMYPDIAVPLELMPNFVVATGTNQSIWMDIYIPKEAPSGDYRGTIEVSTSGAETRNFPIELSVLNFALPDEATAKTMLVLNPVDINMRYFGKEYVNPLDPSIGSRSVSIRNRHFQMARRHRITLVDSNYDFIGDQPSPHEWPARLDGSLYSPKHGYDGPGENVPHDLFAIGLYGGWGWRDQGKEEMWKHTDNWEAWFRQHAPATERFLYLIDESTDYAQIERWAHWMRTNPGVGKGLMSFATMEMPKGIKETPSLSIAASTISIADNTAWEEAAKKFRERSGDHLMMYNGHRPASGSFVTEDDGTALRELPWGQWKKGIHRWFYWESTYYHNYQGRTAEERVQTNLFETAQTFGGKPKSDEVLGETGWNYSNGDGVLFYPGTDMVYPKVSYGVDGPLASLRMKYWRRGIQDVDYVALASKSDPAHTKSIVDRMVPKVLWEYGVADRRDPTWQKTDISWSTDPDDWERSRHELAKIIENGSKARE